MINDTELFIGYEKIKKKRESVPFYIYQYTLNANEYNKINRSEINVSCDSIGIDDTNLYMSIHPWYTNRTKGALLYSFTHNDSLCDLLKYISKSNNIYVSYYEYYNEKIIIKLRCSDESLFDYLLSNDNFKYTINTTNNTTIEFNEDDYIIQVNLYISTNTEVLKFTDIFKCIQIILESYDKEEYDNRDLSVRTVGYMCEECFTKQDIKIKYGHKEKINNDAKTKIVYGVGVNGEIKCKKCNSNKLVQIDYNLLDAICMFNQKGCITLACCESHYNDDVGLYISFADTNSVRKLFEHLEAAKSKYKYYRIEKRSDHYVLRYSTMMPLGDSDIVDKFDAIKEIMDIAKSVPDQNQNQD